MDFFFERAQNSQRVSVRSHTGTPDNRCVGSRQVWLRACLPSVRRADRDVEAGVRVAQGRGENIRQPQVSARDEPRELHLSRAVTRLSCCVYQRGDRVVSARGLAHHAAGRLPFWQAAQGTGSQGPAHHRRRRTESTYSSNSITAPWCRSRRHVHV